MKKILIVDDEPHIALVIKQFLERAGLIVYSALNGKLAIDIINKEHPSAIVADVQMPVMGGIELCERLQQTMPDYAPLIILMSSRMEGDISVWVKQNKSVSLMKKPISMRRLLTRIKIPIANTKE